MNTGLFSKLNSFADLAKSPEAPECLCAKRLPVLKSRFGGCDAEDLSCFFLPFRIRLRPSGGRVIDLWQPMRGEGSTGDATRGRAGWSVTTAHTNCVCTPSRPPIPHIHSRMCTARRVLLSLVERLWCAARIQLGHPRAEGNRVLEAIGLRRGHTGQHEMLQKQYRRQPCYSAGDDEKKSECDHVCGDIRTACVPGARARVSVCVRCWSSVKMTLALAFTVKVMLMPDVTLS